LNQAIIEKEITDPAQVLANMNHSIRLVFREQNQVVETQQGMDVSLMCLNLKTGLVKFAGAMRPIMAILNNEIKEWDGDKASIGRYTEENFSFTTIEFTLNKGDSLFLFTDGFCDQFGGPKGKKFLTTRFKQILADYKDQSIEALGDKLYQAHEEWQGDLNQVDDILLLGFRL
jgi:serine phosphatase RsbU (regulator of sigma subunit)